MSYESSSAPSEVTPPRFGLRIIPALQPSAARGKTAEYVALQSSGPRRRETKAVVHSAHTDARYWAIPSVRPCGRWHAHSWRSASRHRPSRPSGGAS